MKGEGEKITSERELINEEKVASCEGSKNRWDRSEGSGKQKRSEGKK